MRKEIVKRLDYISQTVEELLVQLSLMQDNFFRAIGEYLDITIVHDFDNYEFSYTLKDTLQDMLYELYQKIDKETNPLSEQNAAEFNAALELVKQDTFIGSCYQIIDVEMPRLVDSLTSEASPVLVFHTAAASNSYFSFPSYTISLDFSWYAPFKAYGDAVLSGFMWLCFLWVLFKNLPGIIAGSAMVFDSSHYDSSSDINTPLLTSGSNDVPRLE